MNIEEDRQIHYKIHYEKLLGKFFEAIEGIDIKGLPAIHIPVIGNNYDERYRRIMIYGMETKDWLSMETLKSIWEKGDAYEYLTEPLKSSKIFKTVQSGMFFDFIVKFLSEFYKIDFGEHILQTFMWGNINSLERHDQKKSKEESDKEEPENWKKLRATSKEIFDMHLFAATGQYDRYKEDQDQLRYVLEHCRPEMLLILYWDFNFESWLKKNYGVSWEIDDHENYFCYAHIKTDKIDTHIYKCAHPTYMVKHKIKFKKVIDRITKDFKERLNVFFYECEKICLVGKREFILKDNRITKILNEDLAVILYLSPENEIIIGFENKKPDIESGLIDILKRNQLFDSRYFSEINSDKQLNHIYRKFLGEFPKKCSILAENAFLDNCLYELEKEAGKLIGLKNERPYVQEINYYEV